MRVSRVRKHCIEEFYQTRAAIELLQLGARPYVVMQLTGISKQRAVKLYSEVVGVAPIRGPSPHLPQWYVAPLHNIQASFFAMQYLFLLEQTKNPLRAFIDAYKVYMNFCMVTGRSVLMTSSRAYTLVQMLSSKLLALTKCSSCGVYSITSTDIVHNLHRCLMCSNRVKRLRTTSKACGHAMHL